MPFNCDRTMTSVLLPNDVLLSGAEVFLNEGRDVVLKTKGNSMLPFIRGDRDSVRLRKSDCLEVGDIVLVRLPGRYVMHRIISSAGDNFVMMGDGNLVGTESFKRKDVIGKVVTIIKENGKEVIPGKGQFWKRLRPVRRYLLAIYRRICK